MPLRSYLAQLPQRVMTAEEAIFVRQQALAESPTGDVERKAMVDAISYELYKWKS